MGNVFNPLAYATRGAYPASDALQLQGTFLELDDLLSMFVGYEAIAVGSGWGSEEYTDTVLGKNDVPEDDVTISIYPYNGGSPDWTDIKARVETDGNGEFTVYLDPDEYVMRVHKRGYAANSKTFTVT